MKIQFKYWAEDIDKELDEAVRKVMEERGFTCYGIGYHMIERYRDLVFDDEERVTEGAGDGG